MSFKQIKELRQAGKLEEALQMASQALEADPENIWNKRSISWVYYDYLKIFSKPETFDEFTECFDKIVCLKLPDEEKMVFDNCAWTIGSLVFALVKNEPIDYSKINKLFDLVKGLNFTKPSEPYSFLFKAFHKGLKDQPLYIEFADWWNFENFRSEDFLKEEFNGKKIMAVVEQAYIAYSKSVLGLMNIDGETWHKNSRYDGRRTIEIFDVEKINEFLPLLDQIIEDYPDYQYPPYFKAKMLIALGSEEDALSAFLPFAKQKRNDFWVWEIMAEIFSNDKDLQFACYCKALSLRTPEDFLVKLRQTFAELLVEREMYVEANTELKKLIETRNKHGWKIPYKINQMIDQKWYQESTAYSDNKALYSKHTKRAEEILFKNIPEEVIAVEFVNKSKSILNFIKDKQMHGFFNYKGYINNPNIGDILKVRFSGDGQDGFYKVLSVAIADKESSSAALKNFKGELRVISPNNFGFVEDVFIDPKSIQNLQLVDGQELSGRAILSYKKKKNEWGWKVIEIT